MVDLKCLASTAEGVDHEAMFMQRWDSSTPRDGLDLVDGDVGDVEEISSVDEGRFPMAITGTLSDDRLHEERHGPLTKY